MKSRLVARNPRILVVDDNPAIHDDFRKILARGAHAGDPLASAMTHLFGPAEPPPGARLEFELEYAHQGAEAVAGLARAQAEGRPFALAFVDVRMPPGWDGVETASRLWAVQPDLQIVICTAHSDYSSGDLLRRLGRSDRLLILKKPFDNIEVEQLAVALSEKWRLTRQAALTIEELETRVRDRTAELETSLAQLAQARQMEALGQLAGGVAHDYNNILTATLVQLDLLHHHPEATTGIRSAVQELEKMAQRSARLTRQLLAFSRQHVVQMRVLDLNAVVRDAVDMLRRLLREDLVWDLQPAPAPVWVEADPGLLEQVVTNLCANAGEAMQAAGGRLTVRIEQLDLARADLTHPDGRPGTFARLTVRDTGRGIDAATLPHVFEPFFTTKEKAAGTGLGLATVYGIARQLHGWTEVESQPGAGSTFRVLFPLAAAPAVTPAPPPAPVASPAAPAPARTGGATILLVEDEDMVRRMVSIALKRGGHRILEAADGPAALALWEQHAASVDLLFTDMVMPNGLTGLQLARRLKSARPELKVVITSGYSVDLSKSGVPDDRDFTYLGKPYDISTLGELVNRRLQAAAAP